MAKKNKQKPWWFGLLLMAAGAGIGYGGAKFFLQGDSPAPPASDSPNLFLVILMVMVAIFLVILIHEIGHVIGGLIMGNEFSMMVVGPLKLQKEEGSYSLVFNKSIAMAGGLALTLPTKVEGFKLRRAVTIGGGPLASLLLAISAAVVWQLTKGTLPALWVSFILALGFISAAIFLVTIIPMKTGGFMSDGMQLLMTLRNDEKAKRYANFMHLFALNNKGTEPKDLPIALFGDQANRPVEDIYDFAFQQYLYYKDINEDNLSSAQNRIQLLEKHLDIYPPNFQPEVQAEWAIFYGLIAPNSTELARILEDLDGQKPSMSKVSLHTFEAALAIDKGDMASAKSYAEKVLAAKKLEGTTKMYQQILRKRVLGPIEN